MVTGDLPPGAQLGRYRIVDVLGVGGSATVYRAQVQNMRQMVALKLMHEGHREGDTERHRFAREAEVLRKLQHPHIVGLKDYGHAGDGRPYLVFALLEGRSLKERLHQEGAIALPDVGKISIQVLRALEKAHGIDVTHRDVKPDNIFLSHGVLGEVAQVLDFGLAKSGTTFDGGVTRAGAVLGTPRYIAPEQARGEQVSFPADVYSFGLVMAEMIAGRPVVEGTDDVQIYIQQGSDKPLTLPAVVRQSVFGAIIERAIAKDPTIRYRQASQMLAEVRVATENLGGTQVAMSEAELEATRMMDPTTALRLSAPTEMSEKLRAAFNKAHRQPTEDAAPRAPSGMAHVPPPSREPVIPAPLPSEPILLRSPLPSSPPVTPTPPLSTPTPPPITPSPVTPSGVAPKPSSSKTGVLLALVVLALLALAGAAIALTGGRHRQGRATEKPSPGTEPRRAGDSHPRPGFDARLRLH